MKEIKEAIREKARETGFDAAGFCSAADDERDQDNLKAYLASGRHGAMEWMAGTADRRASPRTLWSEARSVVVLATNYTPDEDPRKALSHRDRGTISVYAQRRDYHDVIKKRLKRLGRWMVETYDCEIKVFVDTAPVMEKPLAVRAGLGWQGKHGVVVSRRFGSWLFLGEIFTSLDLPPDAPQTDHCGSCDRCRRVCPTDALAEPYRLDVGRCIAYLNIELEGHIEPELRPLMGNRVFGCDDCLAVCPWNKFSTPESDEALRPRPLLANPPLVDLARQEEASFREFFAATPVKRTGRNRVLRNVLIAIGNSADPTLAPLARERLNDPSEIVREAAQWALERLIPRNDEVSP